MSAADTPASFDWEQNSQTSQSAATRVFVKNESLAAGTKNPYSAVVPATNAIAPDSPLLRNVLGLIASQTEPNVVAACSDAGR